VIAVPVYISVNRDPFLSYLKFWKVRVVSRRRTSLTDVPPDSSEPAYAEEERRETHSSLKERQIQMEQQVNRIWT